MDRVLIIDDDVELCDLVAEYLKQEGFGVEAVYNGEEGAERAASDRYELVVLDVMLPGIKGWDVLRRIRATSQMPVLMLSARGEETDRVLGLELGADDYLPKPCSPRELVARIRAILRRAKADVPRARLEMGDVEMDMGARTMRRAGQLVDLTTVEFDLLSALLRMAGRVVTRDDLAKAVLGRSLTPYDRSLDMHVSNLRKKLGPQRDGADRIKTVRAVGYIYAYPGA